VTDSVPAGGAEQASDRASANGARLRYRVLTGPDDAAFCQRVSDALAEGYVLHGSPSITTRHGEVLVAQALVLPD
jgi:hypothetical protein